MDIIEDWLASKNVDLWANWRISDPARRAEAAEWFSQQMTELSQFTYRKMRDEHDRFVANERCDVV